MPADLASSPSLGWPASSLSGLARAEHWVLRLIPSGALHLHTFSPPLHRALLDRRPWGPESLLQGGHDNLQRGQPSQAQASPGSGPVSSLRTPRPRRPPSCPSRKAWSGAGTHRLLGRGRVLFLCWEGSLPTIFWALELLFFRGPLLAFSSTSANSSLTSVSGGAAWHPGRVHKRR